MVLHYKDLTDALSQKSGFVGGWKQASHATKRRGVA